MVITWITGIALGTLGVILITLLIAFFWDRICFFWMDKAGPWVLNKWGEKAKKCFDAVICFINTPIGTMRQGARLAWNIFKRGISKYVTHYKTNGDDVEIKTEFGYGDEVIIMTEHKSSCDLDPRIATELHCSENGECEVDNVGFTEEKLKKAEASC